MRKIWTSSAREALRGSLIRERTFEEYLQSLHSRIGTLQAHYGEPDYLRRIEKIVEEIDTVLLGAAGGRIPEAEEYPTNDTPSGDGPYP